MLLILQWIDSHRAKVFTSIRAREEREKYFDSYRIKRSEKFEFFFPKGNEKHLDDKIGLKSTCSVKISKEGSSIHLPLFVLSFVNHRLVNGI